MGEYHAVVTSLLAVLGKGRSLDFGQDSSASPLAREITYGVLRDYYRLNAIVSQLIKKPLASKHLDIKILILAGLYSIEHIRRPQYASVNDVVETATELGKPWTKGIVNGVLRNFIRQRETICQNIGSDITATTNHPEWLVQAISVAWPQEAMSVFQANNTHAPMTLRVNLARNSRPEYAEILKANRIGCTEGSLSAAALYLDNPVPTHRLPGFEQGLCSVQDEASQLAATILAAGPGDQVLDACAAPGGKTCH
ncbi:MAG: transcription antitermination factor NusB, partial [Pseudohongiellaceae bacterium]